MIVGTDVPISIRQPRQAGEHRLNVVGLKCKRADGYVTVNDVSFLIRGYEIFGLAGVSGNGQSELMDALMAVGRRSPGMWKSLASANCQLCRHRCGAAAAFPLSPADRYRHALAAGLSVQDNYIIGQIGSGRLAGWRGCVLRR